MTKVCYRHDSRSNRSARRRIFKYLSDGEWRTFDEVRYGAGGSRWRIWVNLTEAASLDLIEVRDEDGYRVGRQNRRLYRINPHYRDQVIRTVV